MKKFLLIITLILITSCGYKPIYSNNDIKNNEFYKINLNGDKKINNKITNFLSLKENKSNKKLPILFLTSSFEIIEVSKNQKGQTQTYRSIINIDLKIVNNENQTKNKTISDEITYNKKENKFELSEHQAKIKDQLTDGVIEDLVLFLNMK